MCYEVQTWDDTKHCVNRYSVLDAIDFDDASDIICRTHPEEKVISVIKKNERSSNTSSMEVGFHCSEKVSTELS